MKNATKKKKTSKTAKSRAREDAAIYDKINPFPNGGWTAPGVENFTDEQTEAIADTIGLLLNMITFGDFALAHRILVGLEKVATGTHPDLGTLCKNRGPRYFVEGPGADADRQEAAVRS